MSRYISERLQKLVPYTPGFRPADPRRCVKLNTNESPFPPSPAVTRAVAEAVGTLNLYPDPLAASLRAALASELGVEPENVTVSNGSDEVLAFCFHALCPNGAVFADETYGFYSVFCDMFGVKQHIIPLSDDFSINIADYYDTGGTVFIANPNAPTGLFLPVEGIVELARSRPSRLVVVDEAYVDFGGESCVSAAVKLPNLLVVRTFSKSRSLAGARVGFAVGCAELIADLERLRCSFNPYNVGALALAAAEAARCDREYFEKTRASVMLCREVLANGLRDMGFDVTDSLANFVFARPPVGLSGPDYHTALAERGILVRHFDRPRIKDRVRITVGSESDVRAVLDATKSILEVYDEKR